MDRALYQTYRPKKFAEVMGQPQVVNILEKSLEKGNISHAYLFIGDRGTGKTSVARIFAKELGCADIDIFEIDAASHTSVENIREIANSVYTLPSQSDYKVYILDEVHMLSKSAFNAFLKTLEEPPSHTIFILATTEPSKIPDTIISRCINLPFLKPSNKVLKDTILKVAKNEKYTLSEQSASLVALVAEGSFRDGLSALQKVLLVATDKKIDRDFVAEVLGAPRHELVNEYLLSLASGKIDRGLKALEEARESNNDMQLFAKLAIRKLRAAILLKENFKHGIDEYDEDDQKVIEELSKFDLISVELLRDLFTAFLEISKSYLKHVPLEMVLLKNK